MRHDDSGQPGAAVTWETTASNTSLIENAPFGICRGSLARDCFEMVNPALCEMLGYAEAELLVAQVSRQIFGSAANWAEATALLRRDRRLRAYETHLRRKEGSLVRVRVTAFLKANSVDELDDVEAYVEDLTEQSALEQQIRAVQKLEAVGRLAGGIAHDFNNILLVIKLSTEMMLGQITPENPLARSLLQVSNAADRATALTRQMLAFSRRQVMQMQTVNLNSVVNDTSHMLRRIIGEDIQLATKLFEDLASTHLDPDQLSQVIVNLAVNARDAMPHGGTLQIETANVELDSAYAQTHPPVHAGSYVMLAVTDSGTGIDKADLPRIFDPFFTTKEMGKGTGLGLSIVYGIVKQSGGYIWVYSEPGLGTTFKLYFPVSQSKRPQASARRDVTGRPNGETILVIEDNAVIRSKVSECLCQLGYKTLEADNGEAALELSRQNDTRMDLVLVDLVLPGISGFETAKQLRELLPGIPMLFTSGYTEDGATRRELLPEGTSFLQKPYTVSDLAAAVQDALLTRRSTSVEPAIVSL